jgi:hypothetical protein
METRMMNVLRPPYIATLLCWSVFSSAQNLKAQDLAVAPSQVAFSMAESGPQPPASRITVTSSQPWKAAVSNTDMLSVSPAQGAGGGAVTVAFAGWWADSRPPGTYTASVTISNDQKIARAVAFTLTVAARKYPKITYAGGRANGCADVPGLPAANAALCTVPNGSLPGQFVPPAAGGSYVDPSFGARIQILSAPQSMHGYSTPSPVSATGRYVLYSARDAGQVAELSGGRVVRTLPFGAEGALWDGQSDNWIYRLAGSTVRRYDIATGRDDVIVDYARSPRRFRSITTGGTSEITKDNWIAFTAKEAGQVCALDLNSIKTYCALIPAGAEVDYPNMSKGVDRASGQRYVMLIVGGPFALYTVNLSEGRLDLASRGPESIMMEGGNRNGICESGEPCIGAGHSDTFEDSEGNQLAVMGLEEQSPCGYSLYTLQLNKGAKMGLPAETGGGLKRVFPLFRCGGQDLWVDYHAGCAKAAPYCVISTTTQPFNRTRDPNDQTPLKSSPYVGEVMVMRDNGVEMRRLAEHRSVSFRNEESNGYWSTPRAAISSDGAMVIGTSNFGVPNQQRVFAVETGFGR